MLVNAAAVTVMEEKKDPQFTKKVRFDLNEEVFLIPSKWDRLSKCKTTNARIIDGLASKQRNRAAVDRRFDTSRGKQSKSKEKTTNVSTPGKVASNRESNGTFCNNNRPSSTPNAKTNNGRKTARHREGSEHADSRNSTPPIEGRLKLYTRPPQELPKLGLVLPNIPYTPDLKKAIEKALQRSRRKPTLDNGLDSTATDSRQKSSEVVFNSLPRETNERIFHRRLSDSSIRIGDEKPTKNSKQNLDSESGSKFSELSSNVDGWSPFSAWSSKDNTLRSNSTAPALTRGRSMSSIIPSSILY